MSDKYTEGRVDSYICTFEPWSPFVRSSGTAARAMRALHAATRTCDVVDNAVELGEPVAMDEQAGESS